MCKAAQQPVAGNVAGQDDAANAGHRQRRRRIDAPQPAMGDGGQDGRGMQHALELGNVVHTGGRALDLGSDFIAAHGKIAVHGHALSSRTNDSRLICRTPWLSSQ